LLLTLPFLTRGRSRAKEEAVAVPTLPEDLVISERDLRNRVEVTADDFRTRGAIETSTDTAPEFASDSDLTLAERRKQRTQDPEDLVALRGKAGGAKASASSGSETGDSYQRPFVYFERGSASSQPGTSPSIAPAGTVVSAVLASPIDLRAGTSTIIALSDSDGPIAKTSRFVGSASASDDGRLSLRFDRLLLADGREARIEAEAQDSSGAFGLQGAVTTEGGSSGAAVAREVARDTAADAASEAVNVLTGGIGGRLLRRTVDRATTRHGLPGSAITRVSLPAGTHFQIFLHQAVVVRG
jgi:type IV secretory pathway VirB10-like protein